MAKIYLSLMGFKTTHFLKKMIHPSSKCPLLNQNLFLCSKINEFLNRAQQTEQNQRDARHKVKMSAILESIVTINYIVQVMCLIVLYSLWSLQLPF